MNLYLDFSNEFMTVAQTSQVPF